MKSTYRNNMNERVGQIEIVIKGGQPWGFRLLAATENKSIVIVDEIVHGGKADLQGELKKGDRIIKINGIQCLSLADALQLIESAFRTLTVLVWRSSASSIRSSSKEKDSVPNFFYPSSISSDSSISLDSVFNGKSEPAFSSVKEVSLQDYSKLSHNTHVQELKSSYHRSVSANSSNLNDTHVRQNDKADFRSDNVIYSNIPIKPNNVIYSNVPITPDNVIYSNIPITPDNVIYSNIPVTPDNVIYSNIPVTPDNVIYSNIPITPKLNQDYLKKSKENLNNNGPCNVLADLYDSNIPSFSSDHNQFKKEIRKSSLSLQPFEHSFQNQRLKSNFGKPLKNKCTSVENVMGNEPLRETLCCVYPNCHNKLINCKIHSPPERDITYPLRSSLKKNPSNCSDSSFSTYLSLKCSDTSKYVEKLHSSQDRVYPQKLNSEIYSSQEIFSSKNFVWNKDFNARQYQSFSSIPSLEHLKQKNKNSVLSVPHDISYVETNLMKPKPSPPYLINEASVKHDTGCESFPTLLNSKSEKKFQETTSFSKINCNTTDVDFKESILSTLLSFCQDLSSNSASSSFSVNKGSDVMDEELKEILQAQNVDAISSVIDTSSPPLPSPPPRTETEIVEYNEPLPPPPCLVSEGNVYQFEETKTIYTNLETWKIQCSFIDATPPAIPHNNQSLSCSTLQSCDNSVKNASFDNSLTEEFGYKASKSFLPTIKADATIFKRIIQIQEGKLNRKTLNLPVTSAYFTTSVPKAKLLTRHTSKFHLKNLPGEKELSNEKEELVSSIRKKLDVLSQEESLVRDELRQNDELGNNIAAKLKKLAEENELEKFSIHVQEMEKIINLLLSLSGRLARIKNALLILPADSSLEEKTLLESKRDKLTQQYDEALHLQKSIHRRNNQVLLFLQKYLTEDELADYHHFIKMKVKLLIGFKELVEKIKLGEEQLSALSSRV